MAAYKNILSRVRIVYRRSSTLVKCVVLATIVLCTVTLLTLRFAIQDANTKAEDLRGQAAVLEQENQKLENNISGLGTVDSVKKIANEELGLVDPDTVIYSPNN